MGDGTSNRFDFKGKGRATPKNDELALDLTSAEEGEGANGHAGGAFMQMQLVEQQVCLSCLSAPILAYDTSLQDSYIQQRSNAIESIETTIAELGQIFTQLANMVAEQRETVQRIDENVVDIESNINAAHGELSKYLASMMSNRWLMMKMFGVLIVFVSPSPSFLIRCEVTCFPVVPRFHPGFVIAGTFLFVRFRMFIIIREFSHIIFY